MSTIPEQDIAGRLRGAVRGEVRFDSQTRATYSTDGSNYRQVPVGVVVPRDIDDVLATVATCREAGVPIVARGGGTSLAGQCCNVAVVVDFSKHMGRITEIDPERRIAVIEPGVVLDSLRAEAQRYGLTYGPDPATHAWCTLGGMIGNNSCGAHALTAGKTVDNIESLDVLTYDGTRLTLGPTSEAEIDQAVAGGGRVGEIYAGLRRLRDDHAERIKIEYPDIPRRVSGYNLDELLPEKGFHLARALVGSESTCALTLKATVKLVTSPPFRRLIVLGYPDIFAAGDAVPTILEHGPMALEAVDHTLARDMVAMNIHPDKVAMLPEGKGWLLAEFGGDSPAEALERAQTLAAALTRTPGGPSIKLFDDPADEAAIWTVRESALGATAHVPGQMPNWEGWEDSAVHPDRIGDYLRDLTELWDKYGYRGAWYGHIGDGCMHTRNNFDLRSAEGLRTWRRYLEEAAELCVSYGGSLSGEHGDGQARGELLPKMFSPELIDAFRTFKRLWDPDGMMNPGKLIDAAPLDANLRLGTTFQPWQPDTHFRYPDDSGSFPDATLRCAGVGKCRRLDGGTMCPSFMVTREEVHSTRGRARLLFELLQGEVTPATWRNDDVKDALDLCISCKGCRGDCPVQVDMATYKSEFLSHYYARRLRPRHAYALGLIDLVARAASKAPRIANALTQTRGLRRLATGAAGLAPQRPLPRFANQTFARWFAAREPLNPIGPAVLLWPDTFTNYLHPEPGKAAVEVLEDAGFRVRLPGAPLCCGRPLYDYGMLGRAKRLLRGVLDELAADIEAGTPVVGVEPSCLAVFRDELVNLFPDDVRARRLASQTFTLAEFLDRAEGYEPPPLTGRVQIQGHCHQQALWGMHADLRLFRKMGLETELMDSGCCGLAGSFGFEAEHYDVSIQMGERAALPMVRAAADDMLIVADGFSCRTQIMHGTDRRPLHVAEVLRQALRSGPTTR